MRGLDAQYERAAAKGGDAQIICQTVGAGVEPTFLGHSKA